MVSSLRVFRLKFCIYHRSHSCYLLRPSHRSWLEYLNKIWWVQILKFQPPVTSSVLGPNILLNTSFPNTLRLLCVPPAFTLVSCAANSLTLKMGAICSSEMSVDFQRTTRRYIPKDSALHNHRCENLKSYPQSSSLRTRDLSLLLVNGRFPRGSTPNCWHSSNPTYTYSGGTLLSHGMETLVLIF
jgi:hypothetical protein